MLSYVCNVRTDFSERAPPVLTYPSWDTMFRERAKNRQATLNAARRHSGASGGVDGSGKPVSDPTKLMAPNWDQACKKMVRSKKRPQADDDGDEFDDGPMLAPESRNGGEPSMDDPNIPTGGKAHLPPVLPPHGPMPSGMKRTYADKNQADDQDGEESENVSADGRFKIPTGGGGDLKGSKARTPADMLASALDVSPASAEPDMGTQLGLARPSWHDAIAKRQKNRKGSR